MNPNCYKGLRKNIELKGRTGDYLGRIIFLSEKDINRIDQLEIKTNIPEIRASKEKVVSRFRKGNEILGFEINGDQILVGSVAWRFAFFDLHKPEDLPQNFKEYSTPGTFPPANFNAMFHYGINVDPQMRKEGLGGIICKNLFDALFKQGRINGCDYFVSDPRLHTYNGSLDHPDIEKFPQDPKMKEAVDMAIKGKRQFTLKDALRDPAFKIYYRLAGKDVEFIKLMSSTWFPQDRPSGGHGIYVCKKL